MKVDLGYGGGFLSLDIPKANISALVRPWKGRSKSSNKDIIKKALAAGSADVFRTESAGRRVCVLLADGTRDIPLDDICPQVFVLLKGCSSISFILCTGTHEPYTPGNERIVEQIKTAARQASLPQFSIHIHDCERNDLPCAGKTSRGTGVFYNSKCDQADLFLVLSDIKCHYFAGYSNPIKNFVPGLCGYETARENHSWAMDDRSIFGMHPWHPDEGRRLNPLAQDQLEAMNLITAGRGIYSLVTISSGGRIAWSRFAVVEKVTAEAFAEVDKRNVRCVRPAVRLIVSCGGTPNDIDLYIAQRALELTKQAVTDGGEILFVAACEAGIGAEKTIENFYNSLTRPVEEILKEKTGEYKLFSHKPFRFAEMIKRLGKIWLHSRLSDDMVKAIHLYPASDPQAVIDGWISQDRNVKINIVDGACKLALRAE